MTSLKVQFYSPVITYQVIDVSETFFYGSSTLVGFVQNLLEQYLVIREE